jgi:hypothetical protein
MRINQGLVALCPATPVWAFGGRNLIGYIGSVDATLTERATDLPKLVRLPEHG